MVDKAEGETYLEFLLYFAADVLPQLLQFLWERGVGEMGLYPVLDG